MPCYRCGKIGHQASECWCKDLDCRNCGQKGHIESTCKNKKTQTLTDSDCGSDDDEDTVHVLSVTDSDDEYWVTLLLESQAVRMQVDTGTRVSMVSEAVYKEKLQHLTLRKTKLKLQTYTGEPVPVLGAVDVTVEHNEQKKMIPSFQETVWLCQAADG